MLLLLLFLRAAASRCLHDETQKSVRLLRTPSSQFLPSVPSSFLTLPGSRDPQPLRIQTYYIGGPLSNGAWNPEAEGMEENFRVVAAVTEAIQQIQSVLAVLPVQGPLLLNRDPVQYCQAVWGDPLAPNYRKAADGFEPPTALQAQKHPVQTCQLLRERKSGFYFRIPDAHLRGYALWPEQGPPQLVQPDGPGVQNTDFLLYVWVAHTSKCHQEPSLIAYAACCQLDSEDRPLAGTIVYCAQHLTSPSLSHSDIVMATLHELLHALGFSGQLFKKWKDCSSGLSVRENCSTRQQVTRQDEWGQLLLTTPTVSHSLAKHLGVPGASLAVPLEEEGPLSSHWEARLLQGSIMTAVFDGAQRTRLDPITLAAFKDSGWYQVNHSAAQELLWGQGSGLEFGLLATCKTDSSGFFCSGSGLGCHYLHLDKGRCSSDPMLEGCRMYKPLANGSECWKEENGLPPGAKNLHGEIYHSQSRCFLANLTAQLLSKDKTRLSSQISHLKEEVTGRCYLHQCTEKGAYKVQAEGSPWVSCLPGEAIQIPGYSGLLFCPRGRLCQTNESTNAVTSSPLSVSPQGLPLQLFLELAGPPGHSLGKKHREELKEVVLLALVNRGGTSRCYFHSPSITASLMFTVHIWKSPGCQGPSVGMLHRSLILTLHEKPLEVYYGGVCYTTEHKLLATLDPNQPMIYTGLSMGLCLLLLILVGTLGTMVYQNQANFQVAPSASYHSPEFQGTRSPAGGIRDV